MEDKYKERMKKQLLLTACNKILKLNKESLEIIARKKMYHTVLIQKASKCLKDPNPLSTAMNLMNRKFPLAIDRDKAKQYNLPKRYTHERSIEVEDVHYHSKILCKSEAINWWITNSVTPTDENKKVINLLLKNALKEVEKYYNIKWSETRIKWTPPLIQRELVRTKDPLIEIPKNLQKAAIKEVIFPDLTIPTSRVPTFKIQELRDLIGVELEGNLNLTKQLRILMNDMDPSEKYLPILPNISSTLVPLKHTLLHNNLVVTNIEQLDIENKREWEPALIRFLKALIVESKFSHFTEDKIKEIIKQTKIHNKKVEDLIKIIPNNPKLEYLWVKALYSKQTTLEQTQRGLTTCITPAQVITRRVTNAKNLEREIYVNTQHVFFKYGDTKGKYATQMGSLIELTSNYTNPREFLSMLKEIAIEINYRFPLTNSIREHIINQEISNQVHKWPHKFLMCSLEEYKRISLLKNNEGVGVFKLNENSEYLVTGKFNIELNNNLDVVVSKTNQRFKIDIQRKETQQFNEEIQCVSILMLPYFDIKRTLKYMFEFYMRNYNELIKNIKENEFKWKNYHLNKFNDESSYQISKTCRTIVSNLISHGVDNSPVISLLYCFCNRTPRNQEMGPTKFMLKGGYEVDISANSGVFIYDQESERYQLFGVKVKRITNKLKRSDLFNGILKNYKIEEPEIPYKNIKSLRFIEENCDKIDEGETYHVYLCGALFKVTKNSSIHYHYKDTINRQVTEVIKRYIHQGKSILYGKRWLEMDPAADNDDEGIPPTKRQKLEDGLIIEEMEEIDSIDCSHPEEYDMDERFFENDDN